MIIVIRLLQGLSYLPLGLLYFISSCCYPFVYYLLRYRHKVVRGNIDRFPFPNSATKERRKIERDFYRFFCDYAVETIKLYSMSEEEMRRRMVVDAIRTLRTP